MTTSQSSASSFVRRLRMMVKEAVTAPAFRWCVAAGLIFVGIFYLHYAQLEPGQYQDRDDGIITLSHARNLVEFGHIGVEPSGSRIEGYSAPLQFGLYTAVYSVTKVRWWNFTKQQTALFTFLLGFAFMAFFHRLRWKGLALVALVAWFLARHFAFLAWHGSGMENPITHFMFLGAVLGLYRMYMRGSTHWGWAIFLFLASVSRMESMYHIFPLMLIWVVLWRVDYGDWRALRIPGTVMLMWLGFQGWRLWYFGSLLPNTALAQNIELGEAIQALIRGDAEYHRSMKPAMQMIFGQHSAYFLLFLIPFVPLMRVRRGDLLLGLLGLSLILTGLCNPLLFGPTRLDPARTTTFIPVMVALLMVHWGRRVEAGHYKAVVAGSLVVLLLVMRAAFLSIQRPPKAICCEVALYKQISYFANEFEQNHDLHRLNVSTPDLGKLSWEKKYNLTDLGYLGSPVLAALREEPDVITEYLLDFAAPDYLEWHDPWLGIYARTATDTRFRLRYAPTYESTDGLTWRTRVRFPRLMGGEYYRRALVQGTGNREAGLIRDLKRNLSVERIRRELARAMVPGEAVPHQYVVRTAYRFLPELKAAGLYEEVYALFAETPSAVYDQAVLRAFRDPLWHQPAVQFLRNYTTVKHTRKMYRLLGFLPRLVYERGRFRVYWHAESDRLVIAVQDADPWDFKGRWRLNLWPLDRLVPPEREPEWDDCGFEWTRERTVWDGNEALTVVQLPGYPLRELELGPGTGQDIWFEKIRFCPFCADPAGSPSSPEDLR